MTHVYGTFTREALDAQYDTSKQLSDGDVGPYLARFARESRAARDACAHEAGIRYGDHPRDVFDYFPPRVAGAPLFVWVHGGYWRRLSKDDASFVAPPIVAAGGAVAVLNYPLAPEVSLDTIVASVRRAYAAACERAARDGVDPARTVVGGHSVGAQLAATIAHAFAVRGLVAVSGLYDLEPLRHSHINAWIAMDEACAHRNSPLSLPPAARASLVASVGAREQPEFHRQQQAYVDAWRAWGGDVRVVAAPELDHFSLPLELARAASPLARATRDLLGLDR